MARGQPAWRTGGRRPRLPARCAMAAPAGEDGSDWVGRREVRAGGTELDRGVHGPEPGVLGENSGERHVPGAPRIAAQRPRNRGATLAEGVPRLVPRQGHGLEAAIDLALCSHAQSDDAPPSTIPGKTRRQQRRRRPPCGSRLQRTHRDGAKGGDRHTAEVGVYNWIGPHVLESVVSK